MWQKMEFRDEEEEHMLFRFQQISSCSRPNTFHSNGCPNSFDFDTLSASNSFDFAISRLKSHWFCRSWFPNCTVCLIISYLYLKLCVFVVTKYLYIERMHIVMLYHAFLNSWDLGNWYFIVFAEECGLSLHCFRLLVVVLLYHVFVASVYFVRKINLCNYKSKMFAFDQKINLCNCSFIYVQVGKYKMLN
jgi:hypothetical protein